MRQHRRARHWMAVAVLTAAALATPARSVGANEHHPLNFLIWEAYVDPDIIAEWSRKTDVEVREAHFTSGDERDQALANPRNTIDLALVGENTARLFGRQGILRRLDTTLIPALGGYRQSFRERCTDYAVPYLWGTMGILYRTDKVATAPTSWSDLLEPAPELHGHLAMYDDHNEAFVPALASLGASINAEDPETLRRAFEVLQRQAPAVRTYNYVISSVQEPEHRDEIWMALGYSGDQVALNGLAGSPGTWAYAVPREGTLVWLDCLSVVAAARQEPEAIALLAFLAEPEQARRNALTLRVATPSDEALAQLPQALREDENIYPSEEIMARSQFQEEIGPEAAQLRRRILSAVANFRDAQ